MLTDNQREELRNCNECMSAQCTICGHDDTESIEGEEEGEGDILEKTHKCIFKRCIKHKFLGLNGESMLGE